MGRQLEAGAWGITAANVAQVRVMRDFGVERILLANELVDPAALRWAAEELAARPRLRALLPRRLGRGRAGHDRRGPPPGAPAAGARRARRTARPDRARGRSRRPSRWPGRPADSTVLELAGVEGFEGIVHGDGAAAEVDELLDRLACSCSGSTSTGATRPSSPQAEARSSTAWQERLAGRSRPRLVLRSGCYVTHDSGIYERVSPLGERAAGNGRLRHALEVWGVVLSRPEPDLALLLMGKRDVAYDVEPPLPLTVHDRDGLRPADGMSVFELNDQHAYLRLPAATPLAVGDLVGCGISHPCTAFDKWRLIPVVDDDYTVVDAVHTFF